ncbi:uncharacterized protein [Tursiops truncatus]|uniref:uncharacterized protein n=1 Tax=Tursiops truncatus TaxID=9739 RepID=UPI003CCF3C20
MDVNAHLVLTYKVTPRSVLEEKTLALPNVGYIHKDSKDKTTEPVRRGATGRRPTSPARSRPVHERRESRTQRPTQASAEPAPRASRTAAQAAPRAARAEERARGTRSVTWQRGATRRPWRTQPSTARKHGPPHPPPSPRRPSVAPPAAARLLWSFKSMIQRLFTEARKLGTGLTCQELLRSHAKIRLLEEIVGIYLCIFEHGQWLTRILTPSLYPACSTSYKLVHPSYYQPPLNKCRSHPSIPRAAQEPWGRGCGSRR